MKKINVMEFLGLTDVTQFATKYPYLQKVAKMNEPEYGPFIGYMLSPNDEKGEVLTLIFKKVVIAFAIVPKEKGSGWPFTGKYSRFVMNI